MQITIGDKSNNAIEPGQFKAPLLRRFALNCRLIAALELKMNKINRININYIGEFVFFLFLYLIFGYFILGMNGNKSLYFHMSLLVFGIINSFIISEIFVRNDFGYYLTQAIAIPILLVFISLNYIFLSALA